MGSLDRYNERRAQPAEEKEATRQRIRDIMARINFLVRGPESTVPMIDNVINHYELDRLSRLHKCQAGLGRIARFNDGLLLTFYGKEDSGTSQYDLRLSDDRDSKVSLTNWGTYEHDGSVIRSTKLSVASGVMRLSEDGNPSIIEAAQIVAEDEALINWPHAYTGDEIESVVIPRSIRHITKIKGTSDGNPYL